MFVETQVKKKKKNNNMVLNMCRKIEQPSILRKRMTFPAMAQMEKPCDTPLLVMVVIYSNFQKKKHCFLYL